MEKLFLTGGARLEGTVVSSGSKNSTLAVMAGAILAEGETILRNVPAIGDVHTMMDMLRALGVKCEETSPGVVHIDATEIEATEAPYELVKRMRASFCVLGPVLARKGYARVAMPGGCDIGARPIDFHVRGVQALGAYVNMEHGFVEAESVEDLVRLTVVLLVHHVAIRMIKNVQAVPGSCNVPAERHERLVIGNLRDEVYPFNRQRFSEIGTGRRLASQHPRGHSPCPLVDDRLGLFLSGEHVSTVNRES